MQETEKPKTISGFYRRLQNGDTAFIGAADNDETTFQITFTQHNSKDPFQLESPKRTTIVLHRTLLDALISTYFEEYTVKECEAVLIQKLSDKRGFGIEIVPPEKMPQTPVRIR